MPYLSKLTEYHNRTYDGRTIIGWIG